MKSVYLDYNSTTPIDPAVRDVMNRIMADNYGNPSSVHRIGQKAKAALEDARERMAKLIGAQAAEIYFTSGGTESDNMAIKGAAWARRHKGKHLITSAVEHHAVLSTMQYLEREGFDVTYLGCDHHGVVSVDELRRALRPDTTVVSIMAANNETGEIQPIREMADICREAGVIFHTDAVQAVGKMPIDINNLGIDMLSLSAHKLYGPKGIGALYIRRGTMMTPVIHGGAHEKRKRAGTENLPAIVGMATALEIACEKMESEHQRLSELSRYFVDKITAQIDDVFLNGSRDNRIPSTVNLSFKGVEGEAILLSLDLKGVAASSGSACSSGSLESSHVLKAMGIDPVLAQGSIRFSMGRPTTREDLDYTISVLPEIIERLRAMSAAYQKTG
jgi:cysteine desulfurase